MKLLWKYYPVLLGSLFIIAASHHHFLRSTGEFGRWLILGLGVFFGLTSSFKAHPVIARKRLYTFDFGALAFVSLCFLSALWSIDPQYTIFRSLSVLLLYCCCFWSLWKWVNEFGEHWL